MSIACAVDPELYRLALQNILPGPWVGLAHVNEIPDAGDFVLRHIRRSGHRHPHLPGTCFRPAQRPAHTGALRCAAPDEGNAGSFKCPYTAGRTTVRATCLGHRSRRMYCDWNKSRTACGEARGGGARRDRVCQLRCLGACPLDDWLGPAGWYKSYPLAATRTEPARSRRCVFLHYW